MKKLLAILIACFAATGCGSDTDKVKNGTLEFNKTITVGQALDNWKSCESRSWKEFSSENGVKVVQFTCSHNIKEFKEFMDQVKNDTTYSSNEKRAYLDIISYTDNFQFTINKDDTFQIDNYSMEIKWADGEIIKSQEDSLKRLESAYSNELIFGSDSLKNENPYLIALTIISMRVLNELKSETNKDLNAFEESSSLEQTTGSDQLPSIQSGTPYPEAREILITAGWEPIKMPDADVCSDYDDRCIGHPEMEYCAGTGMANCKFTWKKDGVLKRVCTIGEIATFDSFCD